MSKSPFCWGKIFWFFWEYLVFILLVKYYIIYRWTEIKSISRELWVVFQEKWQNFGEEKVKEVLQSCCIYYCFFEKTKKTEEIHRNQHKRNVHSYMVFLQIIKKPMNDMVIFLYKNMRIIDFILLFFLVFACNWNLNEWNNTIRETIICILACMIYLPCEWIILVTTIKYSSYNAYISSNRYMYLKTNTWRYLYHSLRRS